MIPNRLVERIRAEFVAKEISASGYADVGGCDTCGYGMGHAFTLDDVHEILNKFSEAK